tara:strand:+ start:180 stop:380 length:201 start_codon:yes stop_codon:yes gene_type:complete
VKDASGYSTVSNCKISLSEKELPSRSSRVIAYSTCENELKEKNIRNMKDNIDEFFIKLDFIIDTQI